MFRWIAEVNISTLKMVTRCGHRGGNHAKTELDSYECRHGMNYTSIKGEKNGVTATALYFVPLKNLGRSSEINTDK